MKWTTHTGRTHAPSLTQLIESLLQIGGVIHELMHAVGVHHQHNRADRNSYVRINISNVNPDEISNFDIDEDGTTLNIPYSYKSIMHYGKDVSYWWATWIFWFAACVNLCFNHFCISHKGTLTSILFMQCHRGFTPPTWAMTVILDHIPSHMGYDCHTRTHGHVV